MSLHLFILKGIYIIDVNILLISINSDLEARLCNVVPKNYQAMPNLDSILKSRDITLPTKIHLVKPIIFPVVMYRYKSWTVKKPEGQRVDAFKLWCWRRLLRVPWTERRSNQSTLKEIMPEYPLEGLMLKVEVQHFGHLLWKADLLEKILMLGRLWAGEGNDRGWCGWMASPTQWMWVWANSGR